MAPTVGVAVQVLADAELAAAVGQVVIFAVVPLADLVGERVEDESQLGADPVVQLVQQDRHERRLADRLRAEDGDVAGVERDDRVRAGGHGSFGQSR